MSIHPHSLMVPKLPEPSELSNVVALRVIRYASHIRYPNELDLFCPDCRECPKRPVTGCCGHTRCTICIGKHGHCPCRAPAPNYPHVDVLVQELVTIMFPDTNDTCVKRSGISSESTSSGCKILTRRFRWRTNKLGQPRRQPITIHKRREVVGELIRSGYYKEAVPHLAILAASKGATLRSVYVRLLAQVIEAISGNTDPRVLAPELIRAVRRESCASAGAVQLHLSDLECIICCNRLRRPITTPCGHTFCKFCIKRMIVNTGRCALCCCVLEDIFLDHAAENQFINAILASMPVPDHSSVEDDFIPVFNCTVAFPSVACHLMIIDLRACHSVRRILDTGSRIFGMVGSDCNTSEEYGTLLEVKDCVQLKEGCFILSTVGVSRFKILERIGIDGVMMARVQKHTDSVLEEVNARDIVCLKRIKSSMYIRMTSLLYLRLGYKVRADIEAALGPIDRGLDVTDTELQWWEKPDGPDWLWWLIAVLPLKHAVQVGLLSTNLKGRLAVVAVSLQSMVEMSEIDFSEMVSGKLRITEL